MRAARSPLALAAVAGLALLVAGCSGDDDSAVDAQLSATAMATAGSQGSRVEFTGDDCVYTGPTEFTVGDTIDITAVDMAEERNSVGYTLQKVVDGTTVAEAQAAADAEEASGSYDGLVEGDFDQYLQHAVTEVGQERMWGPRPSVAGTWLLDCWIAYAGQTWVAAAFEVAE